MHALAAVLHGQGTCNFALLSKPRRICFYPLLEALQETAGQSHTCIPPSCPCPVCPGPAAHDKRMHIGQREADSSTGEQLIRSRVHAAPDCAFDRAPGEGHGACINNTLVPRRPSAQPHCEPRQQSKWTLSHAGIRDASAAGLHSRFLLSCWLDTRITHRAPPTLCPLPPIPFCTSSIFPCRHNGEARGLQRAGQGGQRHAADALLACAAALAPQSLPCQPCHCVQLQMCWWGAGLRPTSSTRRCPFPLLPPTTWCAEGQCGTLLGTGRSWARFGSC